MSSIGRPLDFGRYVDACYLLALKGRHICAALTAALALTLAAMNTVSYMEAAIDGVELQDLFSYRAESPEGGFSLSVPEGGLLNDFGLDPGDRDPAVTDGYWLLVAPLSKGDHVITFSGFDPNDPDNPDDDFSLDVTYNLTVVGGKPRAVPEPAAALLAAFGLAGFACLGRRRVIE